MFDRHAGVGEEEHAHKHLTYRSAGASLLRPCLNPETLVPCLTLAVTVDSPSLTRFHDNSLWFAVVGPTSQQIGPLQIKDTSDKVATLPLCATVHAASLSHPR